MTTRRISVGPKECLQLKKPTTGFLCPIGCSPIEFESFVVSDNNSKRVLFEIRNDVDPDPDLLEPDYYYNDEDVCRAIKYTLNDEMLRLPTISTRLTFTVGYEKPLPNFRMIERHYFKGRLIKSFDFHFGFCIPGSRNSWEAIYDVPPMEEELINDIIANPYETNSDSFFFIEDELVIHNKAKYRYIRTN
mmetsp:Transcript_20453/g.42919  ORF Transcript_20453/g.42919 Transcript_20453/m.42919 type:complete len:190 (+) Transcript_20453:61-630(+)